MTREEWTKEPGAPYLYVNINVGLGTGLVAYSVSIVVMQDVSLVRDASLVRGATTWETGMVGIVATSNLQHIRDKTKDKVDEFLNAYLSVNPKK